MSARLKPKADLLHALLGVSALIAAVLLMLWGCWSLWTFAMPAVWPTGPQGVINPGYWLFAAEWTLLGLVVRILRGGK